SMAVTWAAPWASSARVRPPGPGPTSITCTPSRGPVARAMRPVRLRSSRKFWPRALRALRPCWRMTSRSGGRPSMLVMRAPSWPCPLRIGHAPGEPERRDEARGRGGALAGDVERRAMVGRGAHEGQAQGDVDGAVEGERLGRDQRLVVI